MASAVGSRLAFEKAKEGIQRAGFSLGQAVLSQSYLRLEVSLSTSNTLFTFPVLQNDTTANNSAAFNTENRLALQDAFYVSQIGIFFAVPGSSTATNFQLNTYPDLTIFSSSNTATSLFNWYNSTLSLTVNNRQIVPAWDVYRHYYVPQQQSATNAYYATTGPTFRAQNDGTEAGFAPVEPGWVLVGSKQNVLQVQLKTAMQAIETNSRAIVVCRGHLAQNVTPVR